MAGRGETVHRLGAPVGSLNWPHSWPMRSCMMTVVLRQPCIFNMYVILPIRSRF